MNWYIRQEIVAIKDHSQGHFKEGDVFIIKALRSAICICHHIEIDIGVRFSVMGNFHCVKCDHKSPFTGTAWYREEHFAPLADISELTEILSQPILEPKDR